MSTNLASFLGKIQFARREFLYGIAAILIPQHSNASSENYRESFSQLFEFLESKYCFSHLKNINWQALNEIFAPRVAVASNEAEYSIILDEFFNEFCDPHTRLHNPPIGTRRTPPYDIFVALDNGNIVVRALLRNGAARLAGIKCGDIIKGINGIPIEDAINAVKPKSISAQISIETENYMLNQAVAGYRAQKRTIDIMRDAIAIKIEVELLSAQAQQQPISSQSIGNDIGYIAIKSFAEESIISQFDALLEQFKDYKGLIIDVRDNGGGDTAIARPIMGRFTKTRKQYAFMTRRSGEGFVNAWREFVNPRGPFAFEKPVVVLCNHWSASMAEGFPMGMRAICGAKIIGSRMMGLGAAVFTKKVPLSNLEYQYSAEPVYDIDMHPRWELRPDIEIEDDDETLNRAIAELTI